MLDTVYIVAKQLSNAVVWGTMGTWCQDGNRDEKMGAGTIMFVGTLAGNAINRVGRVYFAIEGLTIQSKILLAIADIVLRVNLTCAIAKYFDGSTNAVDRYVNLNVSTMGWALLMSLVTLGTALPIFINI